MKACPFCGKVNRDLARFCGHCGKSLTDVTPGRPKPSRTSVRCHECGRATVDVARRTVKTGHSTGRGGTRSYYRKVSLCPECAQQYDVIRGIVAILVIIFFVSLALRS